MKQFHTKFNSITFILITNTANLTDHSQDKCSVDNYKPAVSQRVRPLLRHLKSSKHVNQFT